MAYHTSALVFALFSIFFVSALAAPMTYNVVSLGAKADGKSDSTQAFLSAWKSACASVKAATIYVPAGSFYLRQVAFSGPCKNNAIIISIDGTLVAPSDYKVIGNSGNWLLFEHVNGVTISGGILDGQGTGLWACKASGKGCPKGATHDWNIPSQFHIAYIVSSAMQLVKSCFWLFVKKKCFLCIGSLGKEQEEAGVQNVTVKTTTFTGTQNGVRIKSWGRPSNGFARNILFQHALMVNVQNPIVIDQNYCPNNKGCPGQVSGIKISDVTYQDIHGTSATEVAVKFDCSSRNPCSNIRLEDVKLTYKNQAAEASCNHAAGTSSGFVQPTSCL
ncbi:polygalacturonase-like [Fagus crenata]